MHQALAFQQRALAMARQIAEDGAIGSYFLLRTLAVSLYRTASMLADIDGRDEEAAALRHQLVAVLVGWQQRGGALDAPMVELLAQLAPADDRDGG